MAVGDPELISESPVVAIGFKPEIDETQWSATRVIHIINDNSLTPQVEAEVKPKNGDKN